MDNYHGQVLSSRLFEAIRNNNIDGVRTCISQGVDLKLKNVLYSAAHFDDSDYVCPLALACCLCHDTIMMELLRAGADPNQVSGPCSPPPFMYSAYARGITLSIIQTMISYGADINLTDGDGSTLLHCLSRGAINDTSDNLLCAVKFLLDNGASFYVLDNISYTPLHCACIYGNIDLVKLFIDEGFDVNFSDETGCVADLLEVAIESRHLDIFDFLLAAGANRHLRMCALITPCNFNDHALLVRVLDTCDVDINMVFTDDIRGKTILHHACYDRRVNSETLELLLNHGGNVRAVSATGDTALHYAINNCDCSKVRQLLVYNTPLNIRNNKNQTPLISLMRAGSMSSRYKERSQAKVLCFQMLVAAGANANTADFENELHELLIKHPETHISDYEVSSTRSLKEMCRLVIRGAIHVPVDVNLCKLAIPKLLQEYLNFPEFDPLVDEYLKITHWQ